MEHVHIHNTRGSKSKHLRDLKQQQQQFPLLKVLHIVGGKLWLTSKQLCVRKENRSNSRNWVYESKCINVIVNSMVVIFYCQFCGN